MRTKTFLNKALFAAAFAVGANCLVAAPLADNWIEQHAKAKLGVYTAEPSQSRPQLQPAENWMEQNHKVKMGTYSPSEEARIREVQNSTAFRQEISNVPVQNWIDRNRQVKQGQ